MHVEKFLPKITPEGVLLSATDEHFAKDLCPTSYAGFTVVASAAVDDSVLLARGAAWVAFTGATHGVVIDRDTVHGLRTIEFRAWRVEPKAWPLMPAGVRPKPLPPPR